MNILKTNPPLTARAFIACWWVVAVSALSTTALAQEVIPGGELPIPGRELLHLSKEHPLIEWIEARLKTLESDLSAEEIERLLNREIASAGVCRPAGVDRGFCEDAAGINEESDEQDRFSNIGVKRFPNSRVAVVSLNYSLKCGVGQELFMYLTGNSQRDWRRFWQISRDNDREWMGLPETVNVSEGLGTGKPGFIVASGDYSHCNSTWEYGRYRIWKVSPATLETKLIVDEQRATTIDGPLGMKSRVKGDIVRIEWDDHTYIAAYRIAHDRLERMEPIAIDPIGFTLEWLRGSWADIMTWPVSASANHGFRNQHENLWKRGVGQPSHMFEGNPFSALKCRRERNTWQVKIDDWKGNSGPSFFVVRSRANDRFALRSVADRPRGDCDVLDPSLPPKSSFYPYWDEAYRKRLTDWPDTGP